MPVGHARRKGGRGDPRVLRRRHPARRARAPRLPRVLARAPRLLPGAAVLVPRLPALRRPRRVKAAPVPGVQPGARGAAQGRTAAAPVTRSAARAAHPSPPARRPRRGPRAGQVGRGPLRRVRPLRRPLPAALRGEPQGRRTLGRARDRDPPLHPLPAARARGAPQGGLGVGLPGGAGGAFRADDRGDDALRHPAGSRTSTPGSTSSCRRSRAPSSADRCSCSGTSSRS